MRLLLADDHVLFREALITLLQALRKEWDIQTVSSFTEAYEAVQKADNPFDIVLLDLRMPGMHGMDGLQKIRDNYPDQAVAILSGVAEEHHVNSIMALGARAYFPKTLSGKALAKAIELVVTGGQKFVPTDNSGMQIMPSYYDDSDSLSHKGRGLNSALSQEITDKAKKIIESLTNREKEVLGYLTRGLSNKNIAAEMNLQITTVKLHVGNICKKLGVDSRTQAVIMCHEYNLIHLLDD